MKGQETEKRGFGKMASTLYISHNGLTEPLGRSQVAPYLQGLWRRGHHVDVLSFEPAGHPPLGRLGFPWPHTAHIREPGSGWVSKIQDFNGGVKAAVESLERGYRKRSPVDLIHCRSYLPCAMGLFARHNFFARGKGRRRWSRELLKLARTGRPLPGRPGPKVIFDLRGFLPQEYVDAKHWSVLSSKYLWSKAFEAQLLATVDAVVVLTRRARSFLEKWYEQSGVDPPPMKVIPCCVDTHRFRRDEVTGKRIRERLGFTGPVMVYSGSLGSWYMAEEMAMAYEVLRRRSPSLCFMVLTQSPIEWIRRPLMRRGVLDEQVEITRCPHEEVPVYLSAADMGISFIRPALSKAASSPTKIAEYLSCGLPVVTNGGVGDLDDLAADSPHVHRIPRVTEQALVEWGSTIEFQVIRSQEVRTACRELAQERFHLQDVGVARYHELYQLLLEP